MDLLLGTTAFAIGVFVVLAPMRAIKIWGWKQMYQLEPRRRTLYVRCYQVFGISLSLSGILVALSGIFGWR
jgi:hypothetical protein